MHLYLVKLVSRKEFMYKQKRLASIKKWAAIGD